MLDSLNDETFGGTSAPSTMKYADLTHGKSNEGVRCISSSSLVGVLLYPLLVNSSGGFLAAKNWVFVIYHTYC